MTPSGWEGTVGPFRADYGKPHVYARDISSGSGNCVCGADLGAWVHIQAAPGVPIPESMRHGTPTAEQTAWDERSRR
jgi:hypothetical protein